MPTAVAQSRKINHWIFEPCFAATNEYVVALKSTTTVSIVIPPDVTLVQGLLHAQTESNLNVPLPPAVVFEAKSRQIPLNAIKLRGQEWIACVEDGSHVETCIVLGRKREPSQDISGDPLGVRRLTKLRFGDRLVIDRYGLPRLEYTLSSNLLRQQSVISELGSLSIEPDSSLTFVLASMRQAKVTVENDGALHTIDALPRYKREGPQLVRTNDVQLVANYMEQHPLEQFMVIVTVPSQCEPCRRFEPIVVKSLEAWYFRQVRK